MSRAVGGWCGPGVLNAGVNLATGGLVLEGWPLVSLKRLDRKGMRFVSKLILQIWASPAQGLMAIVCDC